MMRMGLGAVCAVLLLILVLVLAAVTAGGLRGPDYVGGGRRPAGARWAVADPLTFTRESAQEWAQFVRGCRRPEGDTWDTAVGRFARAAGVPPSLMEVRLRAMWGMERHHIPRTDMREIQRRSAQFEAAVVAWARRRGAAAGAATTDEAELRAQGAALTPDAVWDRSIPAVAGAPPVRWVDAKNYPHYDSPLVAARTAAQAAKYVAKYGPGLFVYRGGIMAGAAVPPGVTVVTFESLE